MELRIAVLGCALFSCTSSAPPAPKPAQPERKTRAAENKAKEVLPFADHLPAGLYWEGYRTCTSCPQKVWLVASPAADAKTAIALRDAAAPLALPLGFPLVEHGARIQMDEKKQESLWVVYGTLASRDKAESFAQVLAKAKIESQIFEVPEEDAGHSHHVSVTLMPGVGTVPAYRESDIRDRRTGALELYFTDDPKAAQSALQKKTPVCELSRDSVFTPPRKAIEWYRWVPVYCGEEIAFVDWRETRMMSSFFRDDDGSHRIRQVVIVECDVATIMEWPVDSRGHKTGPGKEVLASEGC